MSGWPRKVMRYGWASAVLVGFVLGGGWLLLDGTGRRGLLLAAATAWTVQAVTFVPLAILPAGTKGYLLAWTGSTLVRFGVVGAVAFGIATDERVDLTVSLLALGGLFFALLLLEPWALRDRSGRPTERMTTRE